MNKIYTLSLCSCLFIYTGCTSGDDETTTNEKANSSVVTTLNSSSAQSNTTNSTATFSSSSSPMQTINSFYPDSEVAQITLAQAQNGIDESINMSDDSDVDDWYEITLENSGYYALYMTILEGSELASYSAVSVSILDQFGNSIKELSQDASTAYTHVLGFSTTQLGTHYIHISRKKNLNLAYNFEIQPSLVNGLIQDEKGEYNDFMSMATPITAQELQSGVRASINKTKKSDYNDWYSFTFDKVGKYTLYTTILESTPLNQYEEARFYLVDSNGNVIKEVAQNTGSLSAYVTGFTIREVGQYYLHVVRDKNLALEYNFEIQTSVENGLVQDAEGEYNDLIDMATPLSFYELSNGINGSLNRTKANDYEDWYSFNLDKTGTYTIYTNILDSTPFNQYEETRFEIVDKYTSVVKEIAQNTGSLTSYVSTFKAIETGKYYLHVKRDKNLQLLYNFEIQPSLANGLLQDPEGEYNDVISMATPLSLSALKSGVKGSVNMSKKNDYNDYYSFTFLETGEYTLRTHILESTQLNRYEEARFTLLDKNENVIKEVALDGGVLGETNSTLNISEVGNYYLHVSRDKNLNLKYDFDINK